MIKRLCFSGSGSCLFRKKNTGSSLAARWFCMGFASRRGTLIWGAARDWRTSWNGRVAVSRCEDGTRKIIYSEHIEIFENWIEGAVEMLSGVPVVCVDGLIRMKRKLGREKDLEDIRVIKEFGNHSGQQHSAWCVPEVSLP